MTLQSFNAVVDGVTRRYLADIDPECAPDLVTIESELLCAVNEAIEEENLNRGKAMQLACLKTLTPKQVAMVLVRLYRFARIGEDEDAPFDDETVPLGVYQSQGVAEGIYVTSRSVIDSLVVGLNGTFTDKERKEAHFWLRQLCPYVTRCTDQDLVVVGNGIFDYRTKTLQDYDPDLVFTNKIRLDLDTEAENPVIDMGDGRTWDVESWMAQVAYDDEVCELLWQVLGAVVRPNVDWQKAAFLYAESGSNGKGTFCQLARRLVGNGFHAALSLADFAKDFRLEPLLTCSAIINDENDVGDFIERSANFKATVTRDWVTVNMKFRSPVSIKPRCFVIQCINSIPATKDKSESFFRRQIAIPFASRFTDVAGDGTEVKVRAIKDDYLMREDVLRYVLKRVLVDMPAYHALSEPQACRDLLETFKVENDYVRQFWETFEDEFEWEMLPYPYLYDLYVAWLTKDAPGAKPKSRTSFTRSLKSVVDPEVWGDEQQSPKGRMEVDQLFHRRYGLAPAWVPVKERAKTYRGLVRLRERYVPGSAENLTIEQLREIEAERPGDAARYYPLNQLITVLGAERVKQMYHDHQLDDLYPETDLLTCLGPVPLTKEVG